MKTLEKNICNLLFHNEVVTIHGFGSFVSHYHPAKFNEATQTFLPPSRKIAFQPNLSKSNGLLENQLCQTEKITLSEATDRIAKVVGQLMGQLSEGKKIKWESIGIFYSNKDGSIAFNAAIDQNFSLNHYGLGLFRSPQITSLHSEAQKVSNTIQERSVKTGLPKWMRVAAAMIPVAGLLYMGTLKTDFNTPDLAQFINFQYPTARSIERPIIEQPAAIEYEKVGQDEKETQAKVEVVEKAVKTSTPKGAYHVIVGSFTEAVNAKSLSENLKSKGFEAYVINDNTKFAKVSIQNANTREAARIIQKQIKKDLNQSSWVYKR